MSLEAPLLLRDIQHWMQRAIVHPGGVVAGIGTADDGAEIEQVIAPSRALSSVERLEIYNRSYFARLLECMRAEYSVLAAALGEDVFDAFALGYLEQRPSQSYTLGELGDRFPEYLAETRPKEDDSDEQADDPVGRIPNPSVRPATFGADGLGIRPTEAGANWPEFLIDLARLERTINQVFDGPGTEGQTILDRESLATVSPDRWPAARLKCAPCLTLLRLAYPINDYFTAIRRGEQPDVPPERQSYLAVTRRDYRVYRTPLTAAQFELLSALVDGERVGTAIERAAAVTDATDAQFAGDLRDWFFAWCAAGFFVGVAESF